MLCAGAVRTKNVQNTMLKNLLDAVSGYLRSSIDFCHVHDADAAAASLSIHSIVFYSAGHRLPSFALDMLLLSEMVPIRMDSSVPRTSF